MRPGRVGSLGCEGLAGSREMRVTREVVGSAPVTADDGARAAPSAASESCGSGASPGAVLGAAIERDFVSLQRAVELLVWRFLVRQGRPLNHEALRTTAEDVLQEAIARVLKRSAAYDPQRSAHAWVLGFAIKVLQERRRRELRERQYLVADTGGSSSGAEQAPDTLLERVSDLATTDRQGLLELLDLANSTDRRVLTLRFVYRLRGLELAQELGISHGAARTRLSRALSRLATAYHRADRFAGDDGARVAPHLAPSCSSGPVTGAAEEG